MNKPNWQKLHQKELHWLIFETRAKILQTIREFFSNNHFLEVEVPILTPYPTLDTNIISMETRFTYENKTSKHLFLHTSPEHSMKKLLAAGIDRIYYLGKVFRSQELTPLHNPEFTMLEWYRTQADYRDIQEDTKNLIQTIAQKVFKIEHFIYNNHTIELSSPWLKKTIQELFQEKVHIDLNRCQDENSFKREIKRRGIEFHPEDDWETLFFRVFIDHIEKGLGIPKPLFIEDYPMRMSQMAILKKSDPNYAERTELYIGGLEIANGYSELTDPEEQLHRFQNEQKKKESGGSAHYPIDRQLISALKLGIPRSAGIALGIDRLIMFFLNKRDIQDVLLFPFHQW